MNMREQFIASTHELFNKDERVSVLLGGISIASFNDLIDKYPYRAFDTGICEQTIIGAAAGMSIAGMIPVVHTIAPFLVERAYEQLKIDFGYQKQRGNFITTGASLDYSSFGATHQCPADINALKQIPGFQIIVPGTADEFKLLYEQAYDNMSPTYFRTSRDVNVQTRDVTFGKAIVVKKGTKATVIAIGPLLDMVMDAVKDIDVTILYYTTIEPFDRETLRNNFTTGKILVCEPFYTGGILEDIVNSLDGEQLMLKEIGIPHIFPSHYGYTRDHYKEFGITVDSIREKIIEMISK